jgi:SAM-dependent methyltransferase
MDTSPIKALWSMLNAQVSPAYNWHINDLYNHERRYLADLQLLASLAPTGPILEIGSAPCHMTALLKLYGFTAVGVDLQPERVADLVRNLGLDVRRCDIERSALPFGDNEFACALFCETFEHLRIDPAFVLSEINRVLAPGALLILTTPNVYSLPSIGRFLLGKSIADPVAEFGKLRTVGHMGHVREYSAREVGRFLDSAGFTVVSTDYRYHANSQGGKRKLLLMAYRLSPRCFHREIVIVARKTAASQYLAPLLPIVGTTGTGQAS